MSLEFIFHIGAGKTGSSAIQAALRESHAALLHAGVLSVGLMFEDCPVRRFPWQLAEGPGEFLAMDPAVAETEFQQLLADTIAWARNNNIRKIVWSSESFFDRFKPVIGPLQALVAEGDQLKVLAYVRNHAAWTRSAYMQWGLKHKTYPGRIRSFAKWYESRKAGFAATLATYEEKFPGCVHVHNYDAVSNVVEDFARFAGIADVLPVSSVRVNETPDAAELLLRSLFNDNFTDPVLPVEFERLLVNIPSAGLRSGDDYLRWLMPTQEDLDLVRAETSEDRASVNEMLTSQGEAALSDEPATAKEMRIDNDKLVFSLARILMAQARKIAALEESISAAERRSGD
jgi:hypothetical protein